MFRVASLVVCLLFLGIPVLAQQLLVPRNSVPLPGDGGPIDNLCLDESAHRVLTARKGNRSLTIVDLNSKFVQSVPAARYGQIAIDSAMHQIYLGSVDGNLLCLSYDIFKVQKEIKLPGPIDAITIDTKRHAIYAGSSDDNSVWVVDPKSGAVTNSIKTESSPESMLYDSGTDKVYLVEKEQNYVYAIDPKTAKVVSNWPTGKARKLRGLAVDTKGNLLFAAGHTGKMVIIDLLNGQLVRTIKIADGAEQIAYDQQTERIFCACSSGSISVFDNKGLDDMAEKIDAPPDTRAIALDQRTHDVWIGFVTGGRGYLQRYIQSQ
jgi:YVTN family beta-propeller protein